MESEGWRTDEPEVGQLAKIPKHGCIYECIEIGPGQKVWTNHAGYIWEMFPNMYQWKPITTPEEERLRKLVEELEGKLLVIRNAIINAPMVLTNSGILHRWSEDLVKSIDTQKGG